MDVVLDHSGDPGDLTTVSVGGVLLVKIILMITTKVEGEIVTAKDGNGLNAKKNAGMKKPNFVVRPNVDPVGASFSDPPKMTGLDPTFSVAVDCTGAPRLSISPTTPQR
jgi:hypothetical protein